MIVLITGALGFYGLHMTNLLLKRDDFEKVIGVDNLSREYPIDPLSLVNDPNKFEFVRKDFREFTAKDIDEMNVDIILHFAAKISIPESMEKPLEYFEVNEWGTFKLCSELLKSKTKPYLIYASSPEVYGNPIYTPMDVEHPLFPRSFYAVSKLAGEKHCLVMYHWYGYPVAVIRNFNTYGEHQNTGGYAPVVPLFIEKALKNEPLIVHWDGKQTRDFLYINDAVKAYEALVDCRQNVKGETFNIGTGTQTAIIDLAKKILSLTGSQSEIAFERGRAADLRCLVADISKTKERLNWSPKNTLDEGLKKTIAYFREIIK